MATKKIVRDNKPSDNSNRDSLGIGGLILATSSTNTFTFPSFADVKTDQGQVRYLEVSDGTQFSELEFTPDEGTKQGIAITLTDLPMSGAAWGTELYPPVLRVLISGSDYEIVRGCYTKIILSTGRVKCYGES